MKAGEIFVAGKWQAPLSGENYQPINPANEEPVGTVGKGDERDIDLAVTAARKAFDEGPWPKMSPHERGRIVWRLVTRRWRWELWPCCSPDGLWRAIAIGTTRYR